MHPAPRLACASSLLLPALLIGCGGDSSGPVSPGPGTGGSRLAVAEVKVISHGATLDPTGYTLAIDDFDALVTGAEATIRFDSLPPGTHRLRLLGVARNCAVQDGADRQITLRPEGTTRLRVAVACDSALSNVVVQSLMAWVPGTPLVALRASDGSVVDTLTAPGNYDRRAVVSPDGRYVAFARIHDNGAGAIAGFQPMLLTVATGEVTPLAPELRWINRLTWRADGRAVLAAWSNDSSTQLLELRLAGGPPVMVTPPGFLYDAASCNDGTFLTTGVAAIERRTAAGDVVNSWSWANLDSPQRPACAPDRNRLVFQAGPGPQNVNTLPIALFVSRAGDSPVQVTPDGEQSQDATWSPEGDRIAYTRYDTDHRWYLTIQTLTGPTAGRVVRTAAEGLEPDWAPNLDPAGNGQ